MPIKIDSTNGSVTLNAEDGSGNVALTIPRAGYLAVDGVTNANFTGADLEIGKGGTGASTAGAARTALGLAIGSDVQAYNATYVVDADIGSTVQGYDADTAKLDAAANFTGALQHGGSNVVVDSDIGSTVQAYNATYVVDADIGVSVQGYDADTAKLDVAANFTGALQHGGSNVVVDSDIGTTVLAPNGSGANLTGIDTLPTQTSQSGKFLTTNGSAASWGAAGGALVYIGGVSATQNASTISITSGFSSTYDHYVLIVSHLQCSTSQGQVKVQLEIGGSWATSYEYTRSYWGSDSGSGTSSGQSSSYVMVEQDWGGANGANGDKGMNMRFDIYQPSTTTNYKYVTFDGMVSRNGSVVGHRHQIGSIRSNATGALTGLRIDPGGRTMQDGELRLYGVVKS